MAGKSPKQSKDRSIRIRVTDEEYYRLYAYAKQKNITMTDVIGLYLRKLPALTQNDLALIISELEGKAAS